jgi:1,4-dihydroxy-6-naphthoate synthase
MKIRVGHSPDADDAFMFYALRKKKIPLGDFEIEHVIEDIETLNQRAFHSELEVTALSCHAYALVSDRYGLLPYGASIGEGYGPIVVAKKEGGGGDRPSAPISLQGKRIAIPGRTTTAYLVLQLYEKDFEPVFTPFDQIFRVLEKRKADLGLLIHEGQLTYAEKGFRKVLDLGEWWKKTHGLPLPLGINAIRRDLDETTLSGFTSLFRESLEYAMTHREEALQYALQFGRGIDPKRGDQFVAMYVNDYSLDLGEKGKAALELLFELGWKKSLLPRPVRLEGFVATP